jgi:hypothetical protein
VEGRWAAKSFGGSARPAGTGVGSGVAAVPMRDGMGWVEATHGQRDAGVEYGRQSNSPATAWFRFQGK